MNLFNKLQEREVARICREMYPQLSNVSDLLITKLILKKRYSGNKITMKFDITYAYYASKRNVTSSFGEIFRDL